MTFETDDDRLVFLRDFGATVTAPGGECLGITNQDYIDTDGIDNFSLAVECRTSDVLSLMPKGTQVTIDGVTYRVRTHKPDGNGMSIVILCDP